jgi:PPOX class probable F420-dependent enzyme
MSMEPQELRAFLDQRFPTPLGVVGTLRTDGSPNVTPVWFRWDGSSVKIWTTDTRAWVRHLQRDPRVAFSVQTFDSPYPAVVIRGLTRRYVAPEEVEPYVTDWPALRTIVTISPERIISWSAGG